MRRFRLSNPLDELPPVVEASELLAMQRLCRDVHVAEAVEDYIVRLVRGTRLHASIELGAALAVPGAHTPSVAILALNQTAHRGCLPGRFHHPPPSA